MAGLSHDCARELLGTVLAVMQSIRVEMRSQRTPDLTVPQFRTLVFLSKFSEGGLSGLAEHIGLSLPSMSKMIESLVGKGLVSRQACASDRRRISLLLTPRGEAIYRQASKRALDMLAQKMDGLTTGELEVLFPALEKLTLLFQPARDPRP